MTQQEKRKLEQERSDLDWVLGTEQGRRALWRILCFCGVSKDIEGIEPAIVFRQLGKRTVGLFLQSIITDVSEERYLQMMREARNAAIQEASSDNANDSRNGSEQPDVDFGAGSFTAGDNGSGGVNQLDELVGELPSFSSYSGPAI